jgi:cytochrome c biogenesis protein CcmG, thiol:disulfide interchange protein DsbE
MKNKKLRRSRRKSSPPYAAIFVGAGLLILGVVAVLLLGRPEQAANSPASSSPPSSNEISVVPASVNFPAPELALSDLSGTQESLADYEGQVVLVNNWATWCPPCKAEMPTLLAYYEEHKDQGFSLIAIEAGEPAEEVAEFVDAYGLTFPVWLDPQNKALMAFQNQGLPNSYVIDREGTVRLAWTGAISKSMLEKYVTPLLED